ncbi:hypothetical protein EN742_17460 [Mesorhizobium sp. M4A.F.Ca.ET.020.02.1.1]|nr:hypothetical protein EN742_17460 [Mesorhizobium sp. M4A.F.Ca.ET.020.02.1.1]RWC10918.1 MAG: hypothetical protein EOS53_28285 [Mesorhizobium sp.]
MRSLVDDREALSAVTPQALVAYVRAQGWVKSEKFGRHSDVFVKDHSPELIVPATAKLGDYPDVVSEIVRKMAALEGRSELQVFRDLSGADRDVIRVRAPEADDDGSVRIEAGVEIFANARDLLLSAACAANDPRPAYRAGGNKVAAGYMDRVRLGQTEQGSFVVTLLAPVPPSLEPPKQTELWPIAYEEPFDRRVTRMLADGLDAARDAAEQAIRSESLDPFQQAIQSGVNANLCEALSALISKGDGLEVSVTWARTRPTPEIRRKVAFTRGDGEVFQEAARILRSQEPRAGEVLAGYITASARKPSQKEGQVTINTFIDGKPVSVKTILPPEEFSRALVAHDTKDIIEITGDLRRENHRWWLDRPHSLQVISSPADEVDNF